MKTTDKARIPWILILCRKPNRNTFSVWKITSDLDTLQIRSNTNVSLKDIAREFSEARQIYLVPARFEDINEIRGFTGSEYVYFSNPISAEEAAMAASIYPECRFEFNTAE